jgi:hypothetical protein
LDELPEGTSNEEKARAAYINKIPNKTGIHLTFEINNNNTLPEVN